MHSGVKVLKSREMGFFRKDLEELIVFEKFKSVKGKNELGNGSRQKQAGFSIGQDLTYALPLGWVSE